jgi:uncharacterized protein
MLFAWDPDNATANFRKRRVAFDEAVTVFSDPLALIVADSCHIDRAIVIGESIKHRLLLVVFREIAGQNIRIISARRATAHERRRYEEGSEKAAE